jgi:hypothetical protein
LLQTDYVEDLITNKRIPSADRLWLKKMMLVWAGHAAPSDKKKPIGKSCRGKGRKNTTCANNTTVHKNQWKLEEARIDEELAHLPPDHPQPPSDSPSDNID